MNPPKLTRFTVCSDLHAANTWLLRPRVSNSGLWTGSDFSPVLDVWIVSWTLKLPGRCERYEISQQWILSCIGHLPEGAGVPIFIIWWFGFKLHVCRALQSCLIQMLIHRIPAVYQTEITETRLHKSIYPFLLFKTEGLCSYERNIWVPKFGALHHTKARAFNVTGMVETLIFKWRLAYSVCCQKHVEMICDFGNGKRLGSRRISTLVSGLQSSWKLVIWNCIWKFLWLYPVVCVIFIPWPGIEPMLAVKVLSPNHWTPRELPKFLNWGLRNSSKINSQAGLSSLVCCNFARALVF